MKTTLLVAAALFTLAGFSMELLAASGIVPTEGASAVVLAKKDDKGDDGDDDDGDDEDFRPA